MKKSIIIGLAIVFVVSLVSLIGVIAYKGTAAKGPNYNEAVHEQLEAAIEAGDYDAWVQIRTENNLPMKGRVFQVINEDNFYLYKQLHEANEAGDIETANAIKAQLGLGQGSMNKGQNQARNGLGMRNNAGNCGNTCTLS